MNINTERLLADLEALSGFGATAAGGVGRTSFSDADVAARAWFRQRCLDAGLSFRQDGIGTMFARLEGPAEPVVWTGSHLDSVPDGGKYDGALGVMTALECLRTLDESGVVLERPVELVVFTDEEGSFKGLFGSRAIIEGFSVEELGSFVGRNGVVLSDALGAIGSTVAEAGAAKVDPGDVHCFVELHIEQGPILETEGIAIGVVTEIVDVGRSTVTFIGRADHAGNTPMHLRLDPMRGVAAFLAGLPLIPADVGAPNAVATCGIIEAHPGAFNVIPGEVTLRVDIRDRPGGVEALHVATEALAAESAADHGLDVTYQRHESVPGVYLDEDIINVIEDAAETCGASQRRIRSGAGHDSQVIATVIPTGMIFVPSQNGRSHSPAEYTSPEDIAVGARVLLETLLRLVSG